MRLVFVVHVLITPFFFAIFRSLHHPNILQLLSTYMEPPDLCLVMEYMPKGSLYKILHDQ